MLVKNWMSPMVIAVDVEDSMQEAATRMKQNNVRMLPVLKDGRLIGVISDRDLKRASASDATSLEIHELLYLVSKIKVKNIMTRNPITAAPDFTVEETAELLLRNKISGVPVVENGRVVGVISQSDVFRVLIALTGVGNRGIQFAFRLEDRPGSIKEVADIIRTFGGRMLSILTTYENVESGFRRVYIRMQGIDRSKLEPLIRTLKERCKILYMVDHRENRREIYEA